jgi:ammonia channel protein AmtB
MILNRRKTRETTYAITMCKNGGLSGIVGIMVGCSLVEPWAAVPVGIITGWTYIFWSSLLVKIRIDDAVDAIPATMASGAASWLDISHHKGTAYDLSAPVTNVVEVKKYEFSMSQRKIDLAAEAQVPA